MERERWSPAQIYTPLAEEAQVLTKLLNYPNWNRFLEVAVRAKIEEDKQKIDKNEFKEELRKLREERKRGNDDG